jgi:hypothetical protein
MIIDVTNNELELIIEALKARATRHDSMARVQNNMAVSNEHERIAIAMRKLARRLTVVVREIA